MGVYEPREDSEFLQKFVKEHAFGKVLDVGTGSGIQALAAAEKDDVKEVLAIDINKEAIDNLKSHPKIKAKQSDLFKELEDEKFDTIICNPPYLPDEKDHDPALYGGPEGYEWSINFLQQAKEHLNKEGQILFLFSSLTNKERIDSELKLLGYHKEELGMLAMFFERLYVYRIWCEDD